MGTTTLAIAILAMGLAAPATFFSILVGAIRPLPVPEGDRIVRVEVIDPGRGGMLEVGLEDLNALGDPAALESLGAFRTFPGTLVEYGTAATRVFVAELTSDVPGLLRVQPELGRWPGTGEAGETIVIGHDVWMEAYDSDPSILGRSVELEDVSRTIVGVMPAGFGFPFRQNTWTIAPPGDADTGSVELVGRLADGVAVQTADAEVRGRWSSTDDLRDPDRTGGVAQVRPYTGGRGEGGEAVAFIGLVLVAICLLLIACANVANLLLVRATERVRALGIQTALGAGRLQITAQLLLESFLVALVGGIAGLIIAALAIHRLQQGLAAEHFGYFWMRMAVDGPVLLFTGTLVLATALVSGIVPVTRVLRIDVQRVLKESGSGVTIGTGGRAGRWFVTGQLALSCGALVAAGLTGRALAGARGFSGDLPVKEIQMAVVDLAPTDSLAATTVVTRLNGRLEAIPGATAAAVALGAPGYQEPWGSLEIEGVVYDRPEDRERVLWNAVTPGYFGVLDIEVRSGRLFNSQDAPATTPVAVVNEAFVRRFSPDRGVVGQSIRIDRPDSEAWHRVVGVVSDARVGSGDLVRHDRVYLPLSQIDASSGLLLVRGRGDAASLVSEVRGAVADVNPEAALWSVQTLDEGHAYMTRVPRAMGALALGGGVAGLMVAAVGLYGLLAFRVRQRRRELGVRLALGADGGRLARETLDIALRQILPALVVGLMLAWAAAPLLGVFLLGLDPRSPSTFAAVAVAFLGVGLLSAGVPALRASRTDPAEVLRGE